MSFVRKYQKDSIQARTVPLTPLNLYLERVRSVTDQLRADAEGLSYTPLQFGGVDGQLQSLLANSVVTLVDFKVNQE